MRKFILAATVAALSLSAAPAFAQEASSFTGPRIAVNIGTGGDDFIDFDGQTVGVEVGYDFDAGGAVMGIGAEYQTDLGDDIFEFSESAIIARVGARVGSKALLFGTGGYTRLSDSAMPFGGNGADGYRLGVGVEFGRFKVEQRYSDYGSGVNAWQTVAGLNFRF